MQSWRTVLPLSVLGGIKCALLQEFPILVHLYKLTSTLVFQVIIKAIYIVSYVGNRGTFEHNVRRLLSDRNLVLHLMYFTFGFLGLTVHTFFYSILVSSSI